MSEKIKNIAISLLVGILGFLGYNQFGAAGVTLFTGSSVGGESLVATTGTEAVARKSDRSYLRVCKTSLSSASQITLAVNASPSHGRGIILDNRVPCWESSDLNLVTGEINGVASPSAASLSYSQW